ESGSPILLVMKFPSFANLDPPCHDAGTTTDPSNGRLWLSKRVHAPAHKRRTPCKSVINKDKSVIRVLKEFSLSDPFNDIIRLSPRYRRSSGEPDAGIWQYMPLFGRHVHEAERHACA